MSQTATPVPQVAPHVALVEASMFVLVPSALLFYGLYAMAAGWGGYHALGGLVGYGVGWIVALARINI